MYVIQNTDEVAAPERIRQDFQDRTHAMRL
jgi:hypothetical protein